MALNLIDLAKDYLTPDVVSKMAGLVGETPAATQKAMGAVVPSLAGIACHQAATPAGASKVLGLVNSGGLDSGVLNNFSGALSGGNATEGLMNTGSNLLHGLLGDRLGDVSRVIANASGVQVSSATKLLGMAAPLFFGLLGKQVGDSVKINIPGGTREMEVVELITIHQQTETR